MFFDFDVKENKLRKLKGLIHSTIKKILSFLIL